MKLGMIADRRDAAWGAKRIFQDIDRGLTKVTFMAKNQSIRHMK